MWCVPPRRRYQVPADHWQHPAAPCQQSTRPGRLSGQGYVDGQPHHSNCLCLFCWTMTDAQCSSLTANYCTVISHHIIYYDDSRLLQRCFGRSAPIWQQRLSHCQRLQVRPRDATAKRLTLAASARVYSVQSCVSWHTSVSMGQQYNMCLNLFSHLPNSNQGEDWGLHQPDNWPCHACVTPRLVTMYSLLLFHMHGTVCLTHYTNCRLLITLRNI